MQEGKGLLKLQSGKKYFVLIDGVFKKNKKDLKSISIPFYLEENLNGEQVEVSYEIRGNNIIVKQVKLGEKIFGDLNYKPNFKKNKSLEKNYGRNDNRSKIYSKTPYNFVPLNKKVLTTPIFNDGEIKDEYKNNLYYTDKLTGGIRLTIINESPLFIGSRKVKRDDGFSEILPFTIQSEPAIPGSSIRGMLYALYEIASYSPMVNIEDLPVYFRSNKDSFKGERELRFGILSQKDSPLIYDLAGKDDVINLDYLGYGEYTLINDSYLGMSSGEIMRKVHAFGVEKKEINFKQCHLIESNSVLRAVQDYKNDSSRNEQVDKNLNIINLSKTNEIKDNYGNSIMGCPIWFTLEDDEVKSIGISKYHRVPAEKRSIDMLPSNHRKEFESRNNIKNKYEKNPYPLSNTEILFGTSETHSSKLRFTDATSDNAKFAQEPLLLKPLLSPKIKSANLYLTAKKGRPNWEDQEKDQELRGFKRYYHKSENYKNRYDDESSGNKSLQSFIRPIEPNCVFEGAIYFKNLSEVELGGLLFVIKLQKDLRHSLGMGKPYGLGQIKLTADALNIFDVSNRYSSLANQKIEVDQTACIKAFENYILKEISVENKKSLWELDRFKKLKGLLMLREASDNKKSEYMSDYTPFQKGNLIIDDPENLSDYNVWKEDFLKK